MNIKLSAPDFQRLTRIVQNFPMFANKRDRRLLIQGAFGGEPKAQTILAQLDLDAPPMPAAVELVSFLTNFGQVAYGKEALAVFLNYILDLIGDGEDKIFIEGLFQKYPLDTPATPSLLIDRWRGTDNLVDIQEKIIGEDTLRHIYILNLALEAAKAVVHIRTPDSMGTGFMIGANLLMTNNHVIASQEIAEKSEYTFNYQLDTNCQQCPTVTIQALANSIFYTNSELDYTIVSLQNVPDFGSPLILKNQQVSKDDRVAIIQHPGGHLKKISMQNNFIAYADTKIVQYTTSTLPGSSGSPVFNDEFQVIAIHHAGGMLTEPSTQRRYLRNQGISMISILKDLQVNAPEIYTQLSR